MMNLVVPRKLKGFRDISGSAMEMRLKVLEVVREEAWAAGFQWIETPSLEYQEVLLGVGGETDKQVYRFEDGGGRKVGLRYDLTVPFARYLSEHRGRYTLPLRKVQMGCVWRAEKPQKGRYREFLQCDFDVVGSPEATADLEILTIIARCLLRLRLKPTIVLNHRSLLSFLLMHVAHIHDAALQNKALIILDKLHKVGIEATQQSLSQLADTGAQRAHALLDVLTGSLEDPQHLASLEKLLSSSPQQEAQQARAALERLMLTVRSLKALFAHKPISFTADLCLARGLGYYTGIIFETLVEGHKDLGSLCSGGRYDDLMQRFCSESLPCVGGSLGVDRLVACLTSGQQTKLTAADERFTHAFFLVMSPEHQETQPALLHLLAQALRDKGVQVLHSLRTRTLAKQFQEASRSPAAWAVLVKALPAQPGVAALSTYAVRLKDLRTSEQQDTHFGDVLTLAAKSQPRHSAEPM